MKQVKRTMAREVVRNDPYYATLTVPFIKALLKLSLHSAAELLRGGAECFGVGTMWQFGYLR